ARRQRGRPPHPPTPSPTEGRGGWGVRGAVSGTGRKSGRPVAYLFWSNYDRQRRDFSTQWRLSIMALLSTVVAFALRQASIESGEQVVATIRGWLVDPSLDLHKAIKNANEHTWHSLTLALGGDGWLDRARGLFSGTEVRGMRDQVKAFLRSAGIGMEGLDGRFRKNCLEELKRLKAQGRLGFESFDPRQISQRAKDFRRFDDPNGLAREARRAAQQLAVEIANEAPHLSQLLQLPLAGNQRPLLVMAFEYFLRQEIVERPE